MLKVILFSSVAQQDINGIHIEFIKNVERLAKAFFRILNRIFKIALPLLASLE